MSKNLKGSKKAKGLLTDEEKFAHRETVIKI